MKKGNMGTIILIIILCCMVFGIYYISNNKVDTVKDVVLTENKAEQKEEVKTENKISYPQQNIITIRGILKQDKGEYILLTWKLQSDIDLSSYKNKNVVAIVEKGEGRNLIVRSISEENTPAVETSKKSEDNSNSQSDYNYQQNNKSTASNGNSSTGSSNQGKSSNSSYPTQGGNSNSGSTSGGSSNNTQPEIPPINTIVLEGIISKQNLNYIISGWSLVGKSDLDKYLNKWVSVVGTESGEYQLTVVSVTEKQNPYDSKGEYNAFGVLKLISKADSTYVIEEYTFHSNDDLSNLLGKEVYAVLQKNNPSLLHASYVSETFTIQGQLVLQGDHTSANIGHYHYTIGQYNIHAEVCLDAYKNKQVKMTVAKGQHGIYRDDYAVSYVKIN